MSGHLCDYTAGWCRLDGEHGGVPDPDPATARVEDFGVTADRDGGTFLRCAHYARGCWWEEPFGGEYDAIGDSLADLSRAAAAHLTGEHRAVLDGSVAPPS